MMRIAYLCADRGIPVDGTKGAAIHVRAIAQALVERGHRVDVVTARDYEPVTGFRAGVRTVPFDRTLKSLRESIETSAGDPILASEVQGLLLNSLSHDALSSLEADGRVDAVYERYSLWSTAGLRFARSRGIPWVLEVNAPLVHEQKTYRELRLQTAAEGVERHLFREADALFVPAAELRTYIRRRVGPRKRIHVLPNGADVELFRRPQALPRVDLGHLQGRFVITFVGSLKPWHGVDVLLRAYQRLLDKVEEAHLLVVGNGPLRQRVEEVASRLGPQAMTVVGEVPHSQIPAWLRLADVGVAPYPRLDRFYFSPLKVVEYMAAGLPVVASSIGQLRQLVRHESTGLLVEPGDPRQLCRALQRLAAAPDLRRRMASRARRRAESGHSWSRIAGRVERVLDALVAAKRASEAVRRDAVTAGGAG